jgi:hypothetical protein
METESGKSDPGGSRRERLADRPVPAGRGRVDRRGRENQGTLRQQAAQRRHAAHAADRPLFFLLPFLFGFKQGRQPIIQPDRAPAALGLRARRVEALGVSVSAPPRSAASWRSNPYRVDYE